MAFHAVRGGDAVIGAIFGKLAEWLFGAGIEAAGELAGVRWFRGICLFPAILISGYITVASALLWEVDSQPSVMGLRNSHNRQADRSGR
jgi:hypothetical protein